MSNRIVRRIRGAINVVVQIPMFCSWFVEIRGYATDDTRFHTDSSRLTRLRLRPPISAPLPSAPFLQLLQSIVHRLFTPVLATLATLVR